VSASFVSEKILRILLFFKGLFFSTTANNITPINILIERFNENQNRNCYEAPSEGKVFGFSPPFTLSATHACNSITHISA
jgi:hypothetical protein